MKAITKSISSIITLLTLATGCASIKTPFDDVAQFGELAEFLQEFCNTYAEENLNFFYISRPESDPPNNKQKHSYAYWMTGNLILILHLPVNVETDYYWHRFNAGVDLKDEIVPTQDDIGSSTYLTSSDWAEEKIVDCLLNGQKIIINKAACRTTMAIAD